MSKQITDKTITPENLVFLNRIKEIWRQRSNSRVEKGLDSITMNKNDLINFCIDFCRENMKEEIIWNW